MTAMTPTREALRKALAHALSPGNWWDYPHSKMAEDMAYEKADALLGNPDLKPVVDQLLSTRVEMQMGLNQPTKVQVFRDGQMVFSGVDASVLLEKPRVVTKPIAVADNSALAAAWTQGKRVGADHERAKWYAQGGNRAALAAAGVEVDVNGRPVEPVCPYVTNVEV